jgi:hypothetical protein
MGSSLERGKRGKGKRERAGALLGAPWGAARALGARPRCSLFIRCCYCFSVLRAERQEGNRKEEGEREKKREGRKRKEKNKKYMEIFPNLKIFREKNKRQFMKLVKIIFFKKSYMPNYK